LSTCSLFPQAYSKESHGIILMIMMQLFPAAIVTESYRENCRRSGIITIEAREGGC
jgi:hypothetical protein